MARATRAASPCDDCDGRCCSAYSIPVTGSDAFRIARGTGLEMGEFLAYVTGAAGTGPGFLLEHGGPTHHLILAPARTGAARPPCTFQRVDASTGRGRCGIYALRPAACRRFPATWVAEPESGEPARPVRGVVRASEATACPPGAWDGHPFHGLSWRVALARERRADDIYEVVVADWNARIDGPQSSTRTVSRFLDHLVDVYGWISRVRRTLSPHEATPERFVRRLGDTLRELADA